MAELEIKHEFDKGIDSLCRACLSVGRRLVPVGQYSNIYQKLTVSDYEFQNPIKEQLQICWECYGLLHKVVQFQGKVQKANEMMLLGQSYIFGSLSSLTTIILTDKHPHTIYINGQTNLQSDATKSEIIAEDFDFIDQGETLDDCFENDDTTIEIPELKTEVKIEEIKVTKRTKPNNRWAKKRALQNKKPKFRMVTNLECDKTIFRKVQISDEELRKSVGIERDGEYYKSQKYSDKCESGFENDNLLEKHNRIYQRKHDNSYTCDICTKRYTNKRHLSAHISNHYYKYECTFCDYTCFNKRERSEHKVNHTKVFECLKCKLRFGYRREFFNHYKDCHEKFICDYCGVSFKMRYCIKDHIRKRHSPFECVPCGKRFARYNGLWLHNKTRHGGPAPAAYCVECDKVYQDVYRYRWHLANSARHKPKKPVRVPCPGCDKVFSKKIYMKDHYNLVHLKFYKYRCEECDKNFIRNADLVKHKRRVHEGILPPKNKICYICGRGFTTNKILTNHVRTHTGERPHACAHCPARFAQPSALHGHLRALHDNTH